MSPVDAVLRDVVGMEAIVLNVRPDHAVDGVAITISGDEMQLEVLIDTLSAIDLALEVIGAVTRLQEDE